MWPPSSIVNSGSTTDEKTKNDAESAVFCGSRQSGVEGLAMVTLPPDVGAPGA